MAERKTAQWALAPIVDWLLDEGRLLPGIDEIVFQLGERLLAGGAPLWRLRVAMRTLHPLVTALTADWERDAGRQPLLQTPHGLEAREDYLGSPFEVIARTELPFRRKLSADLSNADHEVMHDLKARGASDYFGLPVRLTNGRFQIMVCTTDVSGGFTDLDIEQFRKVASVLAPITEVHNARRVALAVAEAYLGTRTGRRVLDGQITRGDVETLNAAILVSDIRDWTGLNTRVSTAEALNLANSYFQILSDAIEANGGEILKFMGDGILAVFPTDTGEAGVDQTCENALTAARQALQEARNSEPPLGVEFGVGMHFGEVLYGNIGSTTRIDFTVMGQAVNVASRIESLCGKLNRPVLFSQVFADRLAGPSTLLSQEILKGQEQATNVLTAPEFAGA